METKRLFIGGLYKDIKEADLRDRFKTFGTITSVEIIRRTDDKGYILKTFAYLDILQTESDFKKCVSILSNSRWKGCCLKVQAAKESFLTRLTRERQQQGQVNTEMEPDKQVKHPRDETKPQHTIPETIPKAVPGTPLPGKKNWVVGKFGRALPVVYLRRRDRKKIAKFDPSKTTHCLKRINLEDSTTTLSDLTWNLDTEVETSNGYSLKNMRTSKLMENGVDAFAFHESTVEKQRKKSYEKALKNYGKSSSAPKLAENISDMKPESNDSDLSGHSCAEVNTNSSCDKTGTARVDISVISDVSPSHHDVEIPTLNLSKKNSGSIELENNLLSSSRLISDLKELKSSSASKMQNRVNSFRGQLAQNDRELQARDLSEETSSSASERQSSDTSDGSSSENEGVFTKLSETVSSRYEHKTRMIMSSLDSAPDEEAQSWRIHATKLSLKTQKSNRKSRAQEDTTKKKLSNDKRLDALLEKKKSVTAQKSVIKDALKDLDSGVQSSDGKKHIVFGDDEEDGESERVTEKPVYSVGGKISGSKASSWLGLDSDEGSDQMGDGRDEESAQLVTVKPHFEGKAGEELFKLQRTFGGDKRFDLDARFLESEDDDEYDDHAQKKESLNAKGPFSTREEDDISGSLKQEKEMAMKVLSSILGGDFRALFAQGENQDKAPEFRSSAAVHYDPTREDHKQFEQTETEEKEKREHGVAVVKEMPPEDPLMPEVSEDKYYDVNTSSLAELFGNKDQGPSAFTFLSQEPEDDSDNPPGAAAEDSHVGSTEEIIKNPWQSTTKLPYDSSDDSDEEDGDDMIVDDIVNDGDHKANSSSQIDELFFFHPDDPELTNRINDEAEPFMRTGSQEDVHEYWVSVRSELTQDYKRKRKDAVRRQNKLAAKRSRHR